MTGVVCYIVGAGEIKRQPFHFVNKGLLIAADGGFECLKNAGLTPDLLIGDMDSNSQKAEGIPTFRYPCHKDETDMMLAVRRGLELGFRVFGIYGGLGGRLDHTLANIQLLQYMSNRQSRGYLIQGNQVVTVLNNETLHLNKQEKGTLSLFSISETSVGVSIKGMEFQLEEAVLTNDFPVGISNRFVGEPVTISVKKGTMLVIWEMVDPEQRLFGNYTFGNEELVATESVKEESYEKI